MWPSHQPHLHPVVEDIEKCEGVTLVTLQGPPGSRTLQVALGAAGEGGLDAEGGRDGEHGLHQTEHGAQDQHLPWGRFQAEPRGLPPRPAPRPPSISPRGTDQTHTALWLHDLGQGLGVPTAAERTTVPASLGVWQALRRGLLLPAWPPQLRFSSKVEAEEGGATQREEREGLRKGEEASTVGQVGRKGGRATALCQQPGQEGRNPVPWLH